MGAPSFGSFGPAGPGFGSIGNISGPSVNPTAFPTAPIVGVGGIAPGGLGGMVNVNLQPALSQAPAPQAFRAPLPLPPPSAGAAPGLAPPPAVAPQTFGLQPSDLSGSSLLNPTGNQAFGMATWGNLMSPQAQQAYANQSFAKPGSFGSTQGVNTGLFGLGGLFGGRGGDAGAGGGI